VINLLLFLAGIAVGWFAVGLTTVLWLFYFGFYELQDDET
jgi:nitrogen fixation-related uncharacterized protein